MVRSHQGLATYLLLHYIHIDRGTGPSIRVRVSPIVNTNFHVFQQQPFVFIRVMYQYDFHSYELFLYAGPVFRQPIRVSTIIVTFIYTAHSKDMTHLTLSATYNITGDSGVNFCKKCKVFHNYFHQILMTTELQLFVLVRVTVNAATSATLHSYERASLSVHTTRSLEQPVGATIAPTGCADRLR